MASRILLVDDNPAMQRLLKAILELSDEYEVLVASSGEEAWEILQESSIRIVIAEWQLPDLDGLELSLRIREFQQDNYMYVIIMTAQDEKECVAQALAAGADEFIAKPIDRTELRWRLQSGLRILNLEDNLAARIEEINEGKQRLQEANNHIQSELAAAAKTQRALLPSQPPQCDSARCAWFYESCDELGGDSLNLISLGDNKFAFYVLDVSGHGVPAALLAVTIHHSLATVPGQPSLLTTGTPDNSTPLGLRPADLLEALNTRFPMDVETGKYFTIAYGCFDGNTGELRYATAGHPGPVLIHEDGKSELLDGGGLPIGFMDDATFDEYSLMLHEGARVCLFSDGVTEVTNSENKMFTEEGVMETLARLRDENVDDCVDALLQQVHTWADGKRLKDDLSALLIEMTKSPRSQYQDADLLTPLAAT